MFYNFYSKKTHLNDKTNCSTTLMQVTSNISKNIILLSLLCMKYIINNEIVLYIYIYNVIGEQIKIYK